MSQEHVSPQVALRRAEVGDVSVFYREAGDSARPAILLLHGFPTSSHQFRDLIPRLADRYHVIAPDLPGFGFTTAPEGFEYSFAGLAETMAAFTDAIGLERYAIYIFDYGAPVGLRLALARPDAITAIVSQNGNAYEEGMSDGWAPTRAYWADPSPANREAMRSMLTLETTRWQYTHGAPDETQVAPEAYWLDYALMSRPGNDDIQLDLIADYASNVALYPRIHQYFRDRRPPLLAVWGKNDPFFLPAGAEAFRRDLPEAEVHFLDTGHFALETHAGEIASHMRDFLGRHLG
jgi:pimeloyl-ACP methyl ester carboxylesterase